MFYDPNGKDLHETPYPMGHPLTRAALDEPDAVELLLIGQENLLLEHLDIIELTRAA